MDWITLPSGLVFLREETYVKAVLWEDFRTGKLFAQQMGCGADQAQGGKNQSVSVESRINGTELSSSMWRGVCS